MAKIYLLDNIDFNKINKDGLIMRLKKVYPITLLNLFPLVLDELIREYVDDVIEVKITNYRDIKTWRRVIINVSITNQFICYNEVSFNFDIIIRYIDNKFIYNFRLNNDYNNVVIVLSKIDCYVCMALNTYMKTYYNKHNYFDIKYTTKHKTHPQSTKELVPQDKEITISKYRINIYDIQYFNNIKHRCEFGYILVINHKLFKNMLVIMTCITRNVQKHITKKNMKRISYKKIDNL